MVRQKTTLKYTWRARLVFLVVFLTIAIFFAMGLAFFSSTSKLIFHAKEKELQRTAQLTLDNLKTFIFERQGDLQVMATSSLLGNPASPQIQKAYLDSVRNIYLAYDALAICRWDTQGEVLTPTIFSGEFAWQEARLAWDAAPSDDKAKAITREGPGDELALYLALPLKSNGNSEEILVAKLSQTAVARIIASGALGDAGFAALQSPDSELFLANLPEANATKIPWVKLSHQPEIYHQGEVIGIRLPLPAELLGSGWALVCLQGADEAFIITEKIKSYSLAVFIFSICVLVLLGIVNSDAVMRPLKAMEESLERSRHLAALGEMAAGVVHEVRNPLTSIRGHAQFLCDEEGSSSGQKEELLWIIKEADRLERMLSRMLSFAHPQEPCWQKIDLNQLVEQVLTLMGRDAGMGQRHIAFSPCQLPPFIGDDDQIRQLLYNLLTNAIRATASEGKIAIQLLPLEEEKLILLKISDDGCGIPPAEQERIFQPFVSLDKRGTGLGLPIVAGIVQGHGGYLHLTSKPGEGTTVAVYLPSARRRET